MENAIRKLKSRDRTTSGYKLGFILLIIACLGTLYVNYRLSRQVSLVRATQEVIYQSEYLMSEMKDAETGVRGYMINHDSIFLEPFYGSKQITDSSFNLLVNSLPGNEEQNERLRKIRQLMTERFLIFDSNLVWYNNNHKLLDERILINQVKGKRIMDYLRAEITALQQSERERLARREERLNNRSKSLKVVIIITLSLAVSILGFGYYRTLLESKGRYKAEQKILRYQDELQQRVEELARANRELIQMRSQEKFAATGRMARTIAHEVRNPLTNINLAMEQLKTEMPVNGENTDFLFDMVSRNSNRINQLITDLLNSTKFSELNFTKMRTEELVEEVIREAQDRITLHNIELEKKYGTAGAEILVDAPKMKIAILNIIINAIEAMETSSSKKLLVETGTENGHCYIRIADTGSGMDPESLSRLFEPYFTSKQKGNGLGMTNTQNIILNHKGTISVESQPGQGTKFTILLERA